MKNLKATLYRSCSIFFSFFSVVGDKAVSSFPKAFLL